MSHSHDLSSRHLLTRLAQTASLHAVLICVANDISSSSINAILVAMLQLQRLMEHSTDGIQRAIQRQEVREARHKMF